MLNQLLSIIHFVCRKLNFGRFVRGNEKAKQVNSAEWMEFSDWKVWM